jgi:hypothetical protein
MHTCSFAIGWGFGLNAGPGLWGEKGSRILDVEKGGPINMGYQLWPP